MNHKTERDEALAKWQRECEGGSVPVTPMMRHAYRDGWDDALAGQSAGVPIYQVTEDDDAWHDTDWTTYDSASNDSRRIVYAAAPAPVSEPEQAFQARVKPWMLECFGSEIAADTVERNHRFFEEAAELVQACGMTASEAHQLIDYTWGRPVGEKSQEVGGVMVTLAALCLANGLDMHASGETELERISRPDMVIRIRAKQAAKPKHSPLPVAAAEHPSERGEQDCPHGVDDGACKQCYGEAVRGSCPDGSVCEIGCFGECEKRAASAPTLGETKPSRKTVAQTMMQWIRDHENELNYCEFTRIEAALEKYIEALDAHAIAQPQAAEPKGMTEAIEALQCPETHSYSNPELFERGWEIGRSAALDIVRALLANGE